ncbi:MAG: DUF2147 domain-containing protein [Alistipes sp.]|nr:DUF2147 domain-containing protein [Alistipes sp.]
MKKFIVAIICALAFAVPSFAQGLNDKADNIIGEYQTDRGSKSKVRISKNADGSYDAQVFWVENPYEADGKTKRKDVKNPDKALRNVPVDQIVLVKGLKYDPESKSWGGAKIYDPTKGLKVNATAEFETADKLKLRGTILGMGVTLYWVRIKK